MNSILNFDFQSINRTLNKRESNLNRAKLSRDFIQKACIAFSFLFNILLDEKKRRRKNVYHNIYIYTFSLALFYFDTYLINQRRYYNYFIPVEFFIHVDFHSISPKQTKRGDKKRMKFNNFVLFFAVNFFFALLQ